MTRYIRSWATQRKYLWPVPRFRVRTSKVASKSDHRVDLRPSPSASTGNVPTPGDRDTTASVSTVSNPGGPSAVAADLLRTACDGRRLPGVRGQVIPAAATTELGDGTSSRVPLASPQRRLAPPRAARRRPLRGGMDLSAAVPEVVTRQRAGDDAS